MNELHAFTRAFPCPICGGYRTLPRGEGIRCYGFLSSDGAYAHCTRPEYGGKLEWAGDLKGFPHRLNGACRCGLEHGETRPAAPSSEHTVRQTRRTWSEPKGDLEAVYVYTGPDGIPLHRTLRYRNPKGFAQQRYERGRWRWGLKDVTPVLYRLPELLAAPADVPVFLCEGEKDADRLAALGLVATTSAMGAKAWKPHYAEQLRGRVVVVVADNDEDGYRRAQTVRQSLYGVSERAVTLMFPRMGRGADISDWLDAGGDINRLLVDLGRGNREARRAS